MKLPGEYIDDLAADAGKLLVAAAKEDNIDAVLVIANIIKYLHRLKTTTAGASD